jgi:heme/copper-type cytochrome/quinol oxidase subunit 2
MGYISLIIGLVMVFITLKFDRKLYDPNESMYQNVNKIGIWAFAVLLIIVGILSIIKDITSK